MQDICLTPDDVLDSLEYGSRFCIDIHELQTVKSGRNFYGLN